MAKSKPKCNHCWHERESFTLANLRSGSIRYYCCYCGETKTREWYSEKDPKHGEFYTGKVRKFK